MVQTEIPENPARILGTHVAMKGLQLGSVLGLVGVYPVLHYIRKIPKRQAWVTSMFVTPFVGMVVTSTMLYMKHNAGQLDETGVEDRAYRISQGTQPKVDRVTQLAMAMGLAFGALGGMGVAGSIAYSTTAIPIGIFVYKGGDMLKTITK